MFAVPGHLSQHERCDGFLGEGVCVGGALVVDDDAHGLRVFRRPVLGLVLGRVEERLDFETTVSQSAEDDTDTANVHRLADATVRVLVGCSGVEEKDLVGVG